MSVLKRLFKKSTSIKIPSEIQTLKSFEKYIQEIEDIDHYISRKEYLSKINDYKNDIDALLVLKDKNILNEYAKKYKIDINYIMSLINIYYKFPKYIDEINQNYLNKKNAKENEDKLKSLMQKRIVEVQAEKGITNYRIYKALNLNPGNVNAFLKKGDTGKVSLNTARKMLVYVNQ